MSKFVYNTYTEPLLSTKNGGKVVNSFAGYSMPIFSNPQEQNNSMCRAFPQCGNISGAALGVRSVALLHLRNYCTTMRGICKFLRGKPTLRVSFFSRKATLSCKHKRDFSTKKCSKLQFFLSKSCKCAFFFVTLHPKRKSNKYLRFL